MANPKHKALFERIYEKTFAGELAWEESPEKDVFDVVLARHTIRISEEENEEGATDYRIRIFDDEGKQLDSFTDEDAFRESPSDAARAKGYTQARELYDMARGTALGVEQALNEILNELDDGDDLWK